MKLREYLMNISNEELTNKLEYLDKALRELHSNGYYVVGDLGDIEIINNEVTIDSFKGKIDYLNSGYNINGDKSNIFELCLIGISAYNKLSALRTISLHASKEDRDKFVEFIMNNEEMLFEHGNIPSIIREYYIDILDRGNIGYMNDFILNNQVKDNGSSGRNTSIGAYTKSTAVGRAFSEKDNMAFVSVLIIPAMLALIYISIVVIYFVFFYNGG